MADRIHDRKLVPEAIRPTRRAALGTLGAMAGSASLVACGGDDQVASTSTASTSAAADEVEKVLSVSSTPTCVVTAVETAGPYPLASVLDNTSIVRKDITEGKSGTPLTLTLKFVDYDNSCAALSGAAVYVWHCDASGEYSGYSSTANGSHSGETYLRGVQLTNSSGKVTFTTIFPGWYIPRLTHIHVEVFLAGTTLSSSAVATATTQLCFPDSITTAVYDNTTLYAKGQNTVTPTYTSDQVFGNGVTTETLTVSGNATTGYYAGIVIGISSTSTSSASGDATSTSTGGTASPPSPPTGSPPSGASPSA